MLYVVAYSKLSHRFERYGIQYVQYFDTEIWRKLFAVFARDQDPNHPLRAAMLLDVPLATVLYNFMFFCYHHQLSRLDGILFRDDGWILWATTSLIQTGFPAPTLVFRKNNQHYAWWSYKKMGGETLGTGFLWSIEADCPLYGHPDNILFPSHYHDLEKKLAAMAFFFPPPSDTSGRGRNPMRHRNRT
jgi:hypothetical protein